MARILFAALATGASLLALTAPAKAETLKDWKCTGNPDIPWDEQIAGCTDALKSGKFAGDGTMAALFDRGIAYQNKGDLDKALADYNQVIELDPKFAPVHNARGNIFYDRGDF